MDNKRVYSSIPGSVYRVPCTMENEAYLERLEVLFGYLEQRDITPLVRIHAPDHVAPSLFELPQSDLHFLFFDRLRTCARVNCIVRICSCIGKPERNKSRRLRVPLEVRCGATQASYMAWGESQG